MNVGCIPSKSLLSIAKTRHAVQRFPVMELRNGHPPAIGRPFEKIRGYLKYINDARTAGMFEEIDLFLQQGAAEFADPHTVKVGSKTLTAKRIFIATGTSPRVPPIPGLADVDYLTNENLFDLEGVPESLVIIGGGAIGCEMAQAFARLGCNATIVHMDSQLVPMGDPEASAILQKQFEAEGIAVHKGREITRVEHKDGGDIVLHTEQGEQFAGRRLLLAAGRQIPLAGLKLENAGVAYTQRGITVDDHLRTSAKHIFAVGDCNGQHLFSHAAMHQGMIALMNAMLPGPMKLKFRSFVVPWTVFSDPQVSQVGMSEKELRERRLPYEVVRTNYADYGAAIAEAVDTGFVKVFASKWGRIYGAVIVVKARAR